MNADGLGTLGWADSWRIARRDLNAGFRGLRLLFICLFLGVATLAAISSLTAAITGEIASQGQTLLGGDIEVSMNQREAATEEKAALARLGDFSETVRMRAMARSTAPDGRAVLTELKGVDAAYPLYGELLLRDGTYDRNLPADRIIIDPALASRLGVGRGGQIRYGTADYVVADIISAEPDRVSEGFTLGPVAIVSMEGLRRSGLIQPGSLFESKYRIRLAPGADAIAVREDLEKRFAEQAWEFKDRDRASPGTNRFIERMGQFLSLIGLTALVIAGIGISNGVASYLAMKRGSIATFKVLGATAADIQRIYMLQIAVVAGLAIPLGLAIGAAVPSLIVALAGDVLPVRPDFRLHPVPLLTSGIYGVLVTLIFVLPPLARARTEPAAVLFRGVVEAGHKRHRPTLLAAGAAAAALVLMVLVTAREPLFSASVMAATMGVLLLLMLLGWGIGRIATRVPRPRQPLLRLALANLYRPGAQTAALVVALGLALTLFVTLATIQTSLDAEIRNTVPKQAPSLFVLDIPSGDEARFRTVAGDGADINVVPSLRGTVVAFGGQRVADLKTMPDDAWILRGERGITYSTTLPEGSSLTDGQWWPADYDGPPLVSVGVEQADALGVGVGDSLTVNVLGREITARIASLREINWETMGFNYILVFSPNTLRAAPHSLTATLTLPDARGEDALTRTLLSTWPGVSVIRVGEIVAQVGTLLDQMANAILAAASVAILAGIAVLTGAIAASRQSRSYDSVILKTLGATRGQVLGAQLLEYGLLAGVLAVVALLLGAGAGWFVIVQIFDFGWAPAWDVVLATLGGGALLTLGIGLVGSLPLMSVRPAQALRAL